MNMGTLSGAPKVSAMQLIAQYEKPNEAVMAVQLATLLVTVILILA